MTRPSWDDIWMDLAVSLSARSTCRRLHVGSVVVSDDNTRVLAVGYNGSFRGGPNDCDSATPGNCGCLHSEINCFLKLNYHDSCRKVLYCTHLPCVNCSKAAVNAGISEVVYLHDYRVRDGLSVFDAAGVIYRKLSRPGEQA